MSAGTRIAWLVLCAAEISRREAPLTEDEKKRIVCTPLGPLRDALLAPKGLLGGGELVRKLEAFEALAGERDAVPSERAARLRNLD